MMQGGAGTLLLGAVGGYWVLERAARQKGNLKKVGQLLGAAIIIISLVGVACKVWCDITCSSGAMGKGGGWCPFSSSSPKPMM